MLVVRIVLQCMAVACAWNIDASKVVSSTAGYRLLSVDQLTHPTFHSSPPSTPHPKTPCEYQAASMLKPDVHLRGLSLRHVDQKATAAQFPSMLPLLVPSFIVVL